ncbi:helix-hairpin-helix domain-containing protein [Methylonatrum kenyense]|uniref:ComEA family DNA-binding protein n=1 Tax=Methylonatrum kenyense TaxID=455253 RepID=UPI0020BE1879|nr:helix-hairpin-helix domain-containing protein [Methylonatrum kenyense]MCK8515980.1 helix-hairpin-helix domain-containing protein [Methylonatrum kenyense]
MNAFLKGAALALGIVFSAVASAEVEVNINEADADTLASQLTGVGQSRAMAIIEHRETHGPFQAVDELTAVSGIGNSTLDANRDRLAVD